MSEISDKTWDTIHHAMQLALETIARSECGCNDPECTHDAQKESALIEIVEANNDMTKAGHPNPLIKIDIIKMPGAFTAPSSETKQ